MTRFRRLCRASDHVSGLFRRVVGLIQRPCRSTMSPVREPNPEMCDGLPRRQNRVTEQSRCFALQSKAEAKWHCTVHASCRFVIRSQSRLLTPTHGSPRRPGRRSFSVLQGGPAGRGARGQDEPGGALRAAALQRQAAAHHTGRDRERGAAPPRAPAARDATPREGLRGQRGGARGTNPWMDAPAGRRGARGLVGGRVGWSPREARGRARKERRAPQAGRPAVRAGGRAGARARGLALRLRAVPWGGLVRRATGGARLRRRPPARRSARTYCWSAPGRRPGRPARLQLFDSLVDRPALLLLSTSTHHTAFAAPF